MFFGPKKEGSREENHNHSNKYFVNAVMNLGIIKNNKIKVDKVKKMIDTLKDIVKTQLYLKLCNECVECGRAREDKVNNYCKDCRDKKKERKH